MVVKIEMSIFVISVKVDVANKKPSSRDPQDVPLDRLVELAEVDAHLHDLGALEIRGKTLNGNLDCKTSLQQRFLCKTN